MKITQLFEGEKLSAFLAGLAGKSPVQLNKEKAQRIKKQQADLQKLAKSASKVKVDTEKTASKTASKPTTDPNKNLETKLDYLKKRGEIVTKTMDQKTKDDIANSLVYIPSDLMPEGETKVTQKFFRKVPHKTFQLDTNDYMELRTGKPQDAFSGKSTFYVVNSTDGKRSYIVQPVSHGKFMYMDQYSDLGEKLAYQAYKAGIEIK